MILDSLRTTCLLQNSTGVLKLLPCLIILLDFLKNVKISLKPTCVLKEDRGS